MLKQYTEEDFTIIKDAAFGRLRPNRVPTFFLGTLIFSGVIIAFSMLGLGDGSAAPGLSLAIVIAMAAWVLHFLAFIFFLNEKICYKFQRLQASLLCLISYKLSLEMYLAYFVLCHSRNAPAYLYTLGVLLLLGGIVFSILSTLRVINRVRQGEFRRGGKGLFNFSDSKGYISLPVFFGIVMIAGFVPRFFSENGAYLSVEPFIALFFSFVIQYGLAIAWPEFYLMAHCKRRFESFLVDLPRRNGRKGSAYENKTKSNKI